MVTNSLLHVNHHHHFVATRLLLILVEGKRLPMSQILSISSKKILPWAGLDIGSPNIETSDIRPADGGIACGEKNNIWDIGCLCPKAPKSNFCYN